jgi:hypothetical protein
MLLPSLVYFKEDFDQILHLQHLNLKQNLSVEERKEQGFVTLKHDKQTLEQMHQLAPSIVIRDGEDIVAYALTMLTECSNLVPALEPMFNLLDQLSWNNLPLNDYNYYVMGQVCIAKEYRGQGLFEKMYYHHRDIYKERFDLFITEIATANQRSVRAHEKIGFRTIHSHRDDLDEWLVAAWDWS